jgi:hypothetical protein
MTTAWACQKSATVSSNGELASTSAITVAMRRQASPALSSLRNSRMVKRGSVGRSLTGAGVIGAEVDIGIPFAREHRRRSARYQGWG